MYRIRPPADLYFRYHVSFLKKKEATLLFVLVTTCNAGRFIPVYYIPPYFRFARALLELMDGRGLEFSGGSLGYIYIRLAVRI